MTLLLLEDIVGIGQQHQIVEVDNELALTLLSRRLAFPATPLVRKRFAKFIREAATSPMPSDTRTPPAKICRHIYKRIAVKRTLQGDNDVWKCEKCGKVRTLTSSHVPAHIWTQ